MAADTARKRFSAMNRGLPWRGLNVLPDATVPASARRALLYLYAFDAVVTETTIRYVPEPTSTKRKRHRDSDTPNINVVPALEDSAITVDVEKFDIFSGIKMAPQMPLTAPLTHRHVDTLKLLIFLDEI